MSIVLYFLMAVGFGMVGCASVTTKNPMINKALSVVHIGGLLMTGIIGWIKFDLWIMLGGLATVLVIGMVFAYTVLKAGKRK